MTYSIQVTDIGGILDICQGMHLTDDMWTVDRKWSLQRPNVTKMSIRKIGCKDVKYLKGLKIMSCGGLGYLQC